MPDKVIPWMIENKNDTTSFSNEHNNLCKMSVLVEAIEQLDTTPSVTNYIYSRMKLIKH